MIACGGGLLIILEIGNEVFRLCGGRVTDA